MLYAVRKSGILKLDEREGGHSHIYSQVAHLTDMISEAFGRWEMRALQQRRKVRNL